MIVDYKSVMAWISNEIGNCSSALPREFFQSRPKPSHYRHVVNAILYPFNDMFI